MMAGTKLDVIWSPVHFDKFIIWGPDITLYEVARLKDIEKKSTCKFSDFLLISVSIEIV